MKQSKSLFRPGWTPSRRTYTHQQIRKYIADFQRSGQSLAAFGRQAGVPYYLLRQWLHRTAQRPGKGGPGRSFQNVPLGSLLGPAWAAEVVSPSGVTVRLSGQVPPSLGLELVALSCRL